MKMWLRLLVLPAKIESAQCAQCGAKVGKFGDHAIICKRTNHCSFGVIHRHNVIRDLFYGWFKEAGMDVEREPLGVRGGQDRPDLLVRNYSPGTHMALDFGVSHPLQKTWIAKGRKYKLLTAADHIASTKYNKYQNLNAADFSFKAATFESFGGISKDADDVVRTLSHFLKCHWRESAGRIRGILKKRIAVSMWTANAKLLLARVHMDSRSKQTFTQTEVSRNLKTIIANY